MKNGNLQDRLTATLQPTRRELDARRLRSVAWLDYALLRFELCPDKFAHKYVYRKRTRSNVVRKWFHGDTVATESSVRKVEKGLPGSAWAYDHPLFRLLENRPFSESQIRGLLAPYRPKPMHPDDDYVWVFPDDEFRKEQYRGLTGHEFDTYALVERRDLWGFTAIVGVVRLAELSGNAGLHYECCRDMYRALPAALAVPWLRRHTELLKTCVELIRGRMLFSRIMFDVAWEVIDRQSGDIPTNTRRGDPEDGVQRAYEDPIRPAYVVPGMQWHCLDETTKGFLEGSSGD